jgi:glycosyltransferase involved in cell wall biosynthesis
MKILQVNTQVNSGSTGRIAEDIGRTFMAYGHESYIVFGRGRRPSASKLIRVGNDLDVYMHGVKTMLTDRHAFGSANATRKLIATIEEIQPDVIAMHNIHGYFLNIEIFFSYLSKKEIPLIWTLHDCWSFTGHCTYFDDIDCKKWKTGCHSCPKLRKYPASYLADASKANYWDKKSLFNSVKKLEIVVPSAWLRDLVKQSFLSQWPVHIIPYGVDIDIFRPLETQLKSRLGLEGKKVVLGCASIWDKRKGLEDVIALKSLLPEEYAVIAVGLTEKQLKALPPGILGITRTDSVQELTEYYNMADVFVNPTYQDNFPTTNLESLACGTPVVTYETGGSPEAVDLQTGKVVPKGDIHAMVEAIKSITSSAEKKFSGACRERALQCYNMKTQFDKYVRIGEQLASSRFM